MVAGFPGLERGDNAGHAFLAHFHAAPDPAVLQVTGSNEILPARDNARGRSAEEFMARIEHQIRTGFEENLQVVF